MSWVEVHCEREDCQRSFKVGEELDEKRCPGCGTKHTPPWDQYDGSPAARPATEDDPGGGDDSTLEVRGGATIRITIEVVPHAE